MNDNAFKALAHERRRTLLVDLLESDPQTVGVDTTTDELARSEVGERIQIELYHTHLPKLEEYGYIEWGGGTTINRGPRFDEIRPLVEFVASNGVE